MNDYKETDHYKGWLFKWTNYIRGYQRRWFVLQNGLLSYYRNQAEMAHTCRGTINLSNATIKSYDSHTFVISNGGTQTFHLRASSEVELKRWITALSLAKAKAINLTNSVISLDDDSDSYCFVEGTDRDTEVSLFLKTLSSQVNDLQTCQQMVKRHGESLLKGITEVEGTTLPLSPLNQPSTPASLAGEQGTVGVAGGIVRNGSLATIATGDSRGSNQSGKGSSIFATINEKATVFKVATSAMINACTEFEANASANVRRWQRILNYEYEQRARLEKMVEELAKQHDALEKKVQSQGTGTGASGDSKPRSVPLDGNVGPPRVIHPGHVVRRGGEESDDEEAFFDAEDFDDVAAFCVSLPPSPGESRTQVQVQMDTNAIYTDEYESETESDWESQRTEATVITKKGPKERMKKGHRRTASSGSEKLVKDAKRRSDVWPISSIKQGDMRRSSSMGGRKGTSMESVPTSTTDANGKSLTQSISCVERQLPRKAPRVRRSMITPRPNMSINMWSIMKNCIGKELSRIPLPVNFNEPLSMLQRLTEDYEYSDCLDNAGQCSDSIEQLAYVAAFTVSSYSTTTTRTGKPFNPLLGETFECDRTDDMGWRSLAEQVSHHPPAAALYCESKNWCSWQEFTMTSKFRGKYLAIIPQGIAHLKFSPTANHYTWRKVTSTVHNIIVGRLWIDNHGEMDIFNHTTGDTCHLNYKAYSYFSRDLRRVSGVIRDKDGVTKYVLNGTWDEYLEGARVTAIKQTSGGQPVFETAPTKDLWRRRSAPSYSDKMYYFTKLAIELNEPEPGVCPTDSRLRPDQRLMEDGLWDEANKEKERLEEKQRDKRKINEREADELKKMGKIQPPHEPAWFKPTLDEQSGKTIHMFNGEYWKCKENENWPPTILNIF